MSEDEVINPDAVIVVLTADEVRARVHELADVLADCVAGGASVNFLAPFEAEDARPFWWKVADDVERGDRIVLAAVQDDVAVGTVQLVVGLPPNQPHRAEVSKLLVRRTARRRGLGRALMLRAEQEAALHGRTLLTLDTAGAGAEHLYEDLGYTAVGTIPGYALWPDGTPCDTVFYWKRIDRVGHADDPEP
ncbi:GNAT family N-acetyltransferase [Segnochrobactrum spirostomi]|uniref:GNAT family N-acetyltransferase n=1 Tax=Segnochrobactrum spirostomi TaxID=2608987 RepID=A0A6A7Y2Z0_9HYPH|nr:GNAT family N-acetyltransferase [Segnochrobactrum spirostomi]MQT13126.1 GNAT family N-acetyltransferase [Segnochrobactrum spirostomi]